VYKCDSEIKIERKFYDSPFPSRQYRVSEEMEELIWIPTEKAGEYLEPYVAEIIKTI
jgi:hypothetical protein